MVPKSGLHNPYKNPERQVACPGCWDINYNMKTRTPTHLVDFQSHLGATHLYASSLFHC